MFDSKLFEDPPTDPNLHGEKVWNLPVWSRKLSRIIEHIIRLLEILLSLFLIGGVIVEGVFLITRLPHVFTTGLGANFQSFLDSALIYIIGLEVALMLIKRDPNLVIDILIFAISRKMIMTMETGSDFLLGALAIFLLYIVKHYGVSGILLPRSFWFGKGKQTAKNEQPEAEAKAGQ